MYTQCEVSVCIVCVCRWNVIEIKMYLVSHSAAETGALIGGLAMTLLTLLVAIQCTRRADKLFQSPVQYDLYHVS